MHPSAVRQPHGTPGQFGRGFDLVIDVGCVSLGSNAQQQLNPMWHGITNAAAAASVVEGLLNDSIQCFTGLSDPEDVIASAYFEMAEYIPTRNMVD